MAQLHYPAARMPAPGDGPMSGENALDPRNLMFSQAYGYEELPQPLKLGEISDRARARLWSLLYDYVDSESKRSEDIWDYGVYRVSGSWRAILRFLHVEHYECALDEFDDSMRKFIDGYKQEFMSGRFNKIFDLLLAIMRHPQCPQEFIQTVADVFEESRLAYVVDVGPPPTIYPAATREEGVAVLQATAELGAAGLSGAVNHLRKAADCINQGDPPGAVRESIHAVESTARSFDPSAKTLEPALRSLEAAGGLHPALKQAFSNLYGFTSDEQGIRHALIDSPQANVGQDEAVFMLGACASFSSYLARKHRRSAS